MSVAEEPPALAPLASLENFPSLWTKKPREAIFDFKSTVAYVNTSQERPLQVVGPGVSSYSGERHSSDSTLKSFVAPPSAASASSASSNSIKRDREPAVAVKVPAAAVVVMPPPAVVIRGPLVQPASRPTSAVVQQGTIVLSKKPRPNAPSVSRSHYQSTTGSNGK